MIYVIWHYKTGSRDKHCPYSPPLLTHAHSQAPRSSSESPLSARLVWDSRSFLITLSHKPWIWKTTTTQTQLSSQKPSHHLSTQDQAVFTIQACACSCRCVCSHICVCENMKLFSLLSPTCSFKSVLGITECSILALDFSTSTLCICLWLDCERVRDLCVCVCVTCVLAELVNFHVALRLNIFLWEWESLRGERGKESAVKHGCALF